MNNQREHELQDSSVKSAEHGLDMENRAYYMTITLQRWLAVRLDFFGNILIFGIALFAAGFRNTVDPSKVGVVLSYTLGSTWPSIRKYSLLDIFPKSHRSFVCNIYFFTLHLPEV